MGVPGLPGRILGAVIGALVLVVALTFSLVLFGVIAVVGIMAWAYLWWKTRHLRRMMREQADMASQAREPTGPGRVFEGEVIREPAAGGDAGSRILNRIDDAQERKTPD